VGVLHGRPGIALAVAATLLFGGGVAAIAMLGVEKGSHKPTTAATSAAAVPPPPPSPAPTAAAVADTVTISAVGDVIMGTAPGSLPPNAGKGMFDPVKTALQADVVMGNLETPLSEATGTVKCPAPTKAPPASPAGRSGCYQFRLPPSYAQNLADAGFTVMNVANNHTYDEGPAGWKSTMAALDGQHIAHAGVPGESTVVQAKGMKIAVLGFAPYSWTQNLLDIPAAQKLVQDAKKQADLVVVHMHAGAEGADRSHVRSGPETYLGENRGDPIQFARSMVDVGADLIVGHSPHVMRAMEFYKGRLIAYSLGNFCGYKVLSAAGDLGTGRVLKVSLRKDGSWAGGSLTATKMVGAGTPAPDPDKRAVAFVGELSKADLGASAVTFTADGTINGPT